eukprot:TRINITY_DN3400_c0_g1_i1.p1 TRINITY_DN3400_c0_g1~~TRINITY_DN3400_c0_g1_i1.p1  ORF type:complete len:186 (+),score=46.63 TRINITY_DN3400_c0_g1_i1:917-1474(+)
MTNLPEGSERTTLSPKASVVGQQELGEELSKAFLRILQANSHVFLTSSKEEQLKEKMTIMSGKVESVVGFYVSMRLSEERKSDSDEKEVVLGSQRWKGLVLGTKKESFDSSKTIPSGSSLVSAPVSSSSSKFDWQVIASLVKEQPDSRLEVTVDRWLAHNNTVRTRVQELVEFLDMEFNDLTVRI